MHRLNLFQDVRAERQAVLDGVRLHQIEQHLLQKMVFIGRFLAGHFIRPVFAIREILRHGATGAAVGEGENGGAGGARVGEAIGVNRHKEIGAVLMGDLHAVIEWNKGIAAARKTRIDTVVAQDAAHVFGDSQHDVLLF